jgi:hypothetical protein
MISVLILLSTLFQLFSAWSTHFCLLSGSKYYVMIVMMTQKWKNLRFRMALCHKVNEVNTNRKKSFRIRSKLTRSELVLFYLRISVKFHHLSSLQPRMFNTFSHSYVNNGNIRFIQIAHAVYKFSNHLVSTFLFLSS